MGSMMGFVVAANRRDGSAPGAEKAILTEAGNFILDAGTAVNAIRELRDPAYGLYAARLDVGQRLNPGLMRDRTGGDGRVAVDVRHDGYTLEAFDPEGDDGRQQEPDHVAVRHCDTSDLGWVEATARAEVDRLAMERGWDGHEVAVTVDRDLLIGGDPAPSDGGPRL